MNFFLGMGATLMVLLIGMLACDAFARRRTARMGWYKVGKCGTCGRECLPDVDCYACEADRLRVALTEETFLHDACESIANGAPEWDKPLGNERPVQKAVRDIRLRWIHAVARENELAARYGKRVAELTQMSVELDGAKKEMATMQEHIGRLLRTVDEKDLAIKCHGDSLSEVANQRDAHYRSLNSVDNLLEGRPALQSGKDRLEKILMCINTAKAFDKLAMIDIPEAVSLWWNDSCRKTWRKDFEDPTMRSRVLGDLATRLVLGSRSGV